MKEKVVIETPYQQDREFFAEYAKRCMRDSLQRDEAPLASHLLYAHSGVLSDDVQKERNEGMIAGLAWVDVADSVIFYCDYGYSKGMIWMYGLACKEGKLISERHIESDV